MKYKRCPSCKYKLSNNNPKCKSSNNEELLSCHNDNCTKLKKKDLHYCFLAINDINEVIAWGASILYKRKVYYIRSFSQEYYDLYPNGHSITKVNTELADKQDNHILLLDSFFPYPTKNISHNLLELLIRLLKMVPFQ